MTAFSLLHPSLQHHIVNSLRFRELRPLQEESIPPLLRGDHALILAPTAGGKTEAAFFPVLSRMLTENWADLGLLYICPLRALLNDLEPRLARYASLVGRRMALWHGDVGARERRKIIADPPSGLLTTPESLEVMLITRRQAVDRLFGRIKVVIVDEIHAFAGDDRGWHLLAVLERIERIASRPFQRIGLSATVGNPDDLLRWLVGKRPGARKVIRVEGSSRGRVEFDYVKTTRNAATIVSKLHRGEKRLVFADSRRRVEEMAGALRERLVKTHVSHSSIARDERRRAESAFAQDRNSVIVATGTLELGIDIGDLDRVIQIDAPATVSSFLQRFGRAGRRGARDPYMLFLATDEMALVQAMALERLRLQGFVEAVAPPAAPLHIFAQQVMALALQRAGITRSEVREWVGGMPGFRGIDTDTFDTIFSYMEGQGILANDQGLLWLGGKGEKTYGRKNFLALFSVFLQEPLFEIRHGMKEVGKVHEASFALRSDDDSIVLSLAGRSWCVTEIDWGRRTAYVTPADDPGQSRWLGSGAPIGFAVCQAMKSILAESGEPPGISRRAAAALSTIRKTLPWPRIDETTLYRNNPASHTWWTFAGLLANAALARKLGDIGSFDTTASNLGITIESDATRSPMDAIERLRDVPAEQFTPPVARKTVEELKFTECLPNDLAVAMLTLRLRDDHAVATVLKQPCSLVAGARKRVDG